MLTNTKVQYLGNVEAVMIEQCVAVGGAVEGGLRPKESEISSSVFFFLFKARLFVPFCPWQKVHKVRISKESVCLKRTDVTIRRLSQCSF